MIGAGWGIRVWDVLVAVLFAFPFLTGGLWWSEDGHLKFELSDVGVPVLVLSAWAWLAYRRDPEFFDRSRMARAGWWLSRRWMQFLARSPVRALGIAALVNGSLYSLASLRRHWALGSSSFDLGIYSNAPWNLLHGFGYVSSVKGGMNLLLDHQSPILVLLSGVFAIYPHPETLLIIQGVGLALGGIALFFVARPYLDKTQPGWLAALPWIYWAYLPMRNANAFDFHPETLMLPIFLAAIAGLQSLQARARVIGAVFVVLGLMCKETAGPVLTGIGLAWILGAGSPGRRRDLQRLGFGVSILGVAVFLFDMKGVPKYFGEAQHPYSGYFEHYGTSLLDVFLAPVLKPTIFWPQVFGPERIQFLMGCLAPLAFLPLLNPRALVAALPGFLILFMSAGTHRVSLQYHYAIEPAVGLFFAMPGAILTATRSSRRSAIGGWVLFWVLVSFGRSELFRIRYFSPSPSASFIRQKLTPCLDGNRSVAASDAWIPHLSSRHWVSNLHERRDSRGRAVDCVWKDPGVANWPLTPEHLHSIAVTLPGEGYRLEYACGTLQLWSRDQECLRCRPECPANAGTVETPVETTVERKVPPS